MFHVKHFETGETDVFPLFFLYQKVPCTKKALSLYQKFLSSAVLRVRTTPLCITTNCTLPSKKIFSILIHNLFNALAYPFSGALSNGLRAAGDVRFTMYISIDKHRSHGNPCQRRQRPDALRHAISCNLASTKERYNTAQRHFHQLKNAVFHSIGNCNPQNTLHESVPDAYDIGTLG